MRLSSRFLFRSARRAFRSARACCLREKLWMLGLPATRSARACLALASESPRAFARSEFRRSRAKKARSWRMLWRSPFESLTLERRSPRFLRSRIPRFSTRATSRLWSAAALCRRASRRPSVCDLPSFATVCFVSRSFVSACRRRLRAATPREPPRILPPLTCPEPPRAARESAVSTTQEVVLAGHGGAAVSLPRHSELRSERGRHGVVDGAEFSGDVEVHGERRDDPPAEREDGGHAEQKIRGEHESDVTNRG